MFVTTDPGSPTRSALAGEDMSEPRGSRSQTVRRPRPFRVKQAAFVTSAASADGFPPLRDGEVAFMGRSNVGKSSLLNVLAGQRGIARVSSTPGRTRTINFFLVNGRYYFVDLPGYGYARVSKQERSRWKDIVDSYLGRRRTTLAVVLLDARVGPMPMDCMLAEWLRERSVPHLLCVTKSDKLSRGRLAQLTPRYAREMATEEEQMVLFSARTRNGARELCQRLGAALQGGRL